MKYCFFILLSLILFSVCSCEKDFTVAEISKKIEGVSDEEYYDDEANTIETNDTIEEENDLPIYNAETGPKVTKIISVQSSRVGSQQGQDDCNKYKYPDYYIVSTTPRVVTVTLDRPDTVRAIIDGSNSFGDAINISDLQTNGAIVRFTIAASKDTLQTKTFQFGLISGIPLGNIGYPAMKFKMKCVGELKANGLGSLYGTNRWMELYHARLNNRTVSTPSPVLITESYLPQFGDVLKWADGHTGTISTVPTSVLRNKPKSLGGGEYRQNRFYLSEMNSRCKGEKTIKFIWHKSFDPNTLKGANKSRGYATRYYRYQ